MAEPKLLGPEELTSIAIDNAPGRIRGDIHRLLDHIAALEADNAALLSAWHEAYDHNNFRPGEDIAGIGHPGAALLEEMKQLRDEANNARELTDRMKAALDEQYAEKASLQAALDRCRQQMTVDGERMNALEAQCARLSAAGQVLSEHVDKAPVCDTSLRDEFAKAALHAYLTSPHLIHLVDDATAARRAYEIADAMLKAREVGAT
jgi:DNA repair exonuclease SbcCD ATPase subunit